MKIYTQATERLKQLHREFKGTKSGIADQANYFDNVDHNDETGNFNAQYSPFDYDANGYTHIDEQKFIDIVCPQTTTGYKEQSTKLNYELDFDFLTQVAERMSSNKGKYEPYNWKKPINVEDLKQALFRHVLEVMKGNYADDGRSMGHLEAIAANAMMINYQLKTMENKEIWKDIKGYEGLYRISSKGRVYGLKRNKTINPAKHTNKQGHKSLIITICKNGVQKSFKLNRLVYTNFIGNINGMIDFKDGDYTNCSIDNLIDVNKTFKFKKAHCQKVIDTETMKVYDSCIELSQDIGVENHLVWYGIKNGKQEYKRYKFL